MRAWTKSASLPARAGILLKNSFFRNPQAYFSISEIFYLFPRMFLSQRGILTVAKYSNNAMESSPKKILLVDDDKTVLDTYHEYIECFVQDSEVSSFTSGNEMLKALGSDEPNLHDCKAVCLDGYLDNEQGWNIARELRNEYGYNGVIILTGALGTLKFPAGKMSQLEAFLSDETKKMDILSKEEASHFDYVASKPDSRSLAKILNEVCNTK